MRGNVKNLIKNEDLTPEQRRENARKAGKASAEARRKRKEYRELLQDSLDTLAVNPVTGEKKTRKELSAMRLAQQAANGDLKAIELTLKILGEFTEKHELTGANGGAIEMQTQQPLTAAEKKTIRAEVFGALVAQIEELSNDAP